MAEHPNFIDWAENPYFNAQRENNTDSGVEEEEGAPFYSPSVSSAEDDFDLGDEVPIVFESDEEWGVEDNDNDSVEEWMLGFIELEDGDENDGEADDVIQHQRG